MLIAEQGAVGTSYGGWLADEIHRRFFDLLDAPVRRVTGAEASPSISKVLERAAIAQKDEVARRARRDRRGTDVAHLLRMPEVAANATEAVLSEWLVDRGGGFAAGDAVATVETEKAVVDIEAGAAGVLLRALVPPGARVDVGAPIALLGDPGETVADVDAALAELGAAAPVEHDVPERREVPTDPGSAAPLPPEAEPALARRVFASPIARKIAKDAGLAIDGDHRHRPARPGAAPRRRARSPPESRRAHRRPADAAPPAPVAAAYTDVPHTRLRRAIAARLVESSTTAPHFYVRATVRVDRLVALRAELNDGADVRVSVNDLVVKAVGAAHVRVPEMNVVWTPDAVRRTSRSTWRSPSPPTAACSRRSCATSPAAA